MHSRLYIPNLIKLGLTVQKFLVLFAGLKEFINGDLNIFEVKSSINTLNLLNAHDIFVV